MLSSQQIQYILQLSASGNFSKAADACFVTQPTLSMQVKKAEELLGFQVFDRDRNPVCLTRLGKELVTVLREMNVYQQQIIQLSKKANGTYTEELTIGIIPTISAYLLPELFHAWKKQLTHTRLLIREMKSEELLEALELRQIDVGIMAGPVSDPKWKVVDLYTEELLAYVKKTTLRFVSPELLGELKPWLLNRGNCLRSQMMQFCRLNDGEEDEWSFDGGSMEVLLNMVDRNGGYTLVPKYFTAVLKGHRGTFLPIKEAKSRLSPARSVIALHSVRTMKQLSIQKISAAIQDKYDVARKKDFSVLKWGS